MKLKTARLLIETQNKVSLRWSKALKGKLKTSAGTEAISFPDWATLAKVISLPRLEILATVPSAKPKSISALARFLRRDFRNVQSDVQFLASLGLIELQKGGFRNTLIPRARFRRIEIIWPEIPEARPAKKTA